MFFRSFLISLFFVPYFAFAGVGLDSPEQLLKRASQGRIELREVILDLHNNFQTIGYPDQFDSYFNLLDQLDVYAKRFNLAEIYPDAIDRLGANMAGYGLRWLSIATATPDRLLYYHKWMNVDVAIRYMDQVEVEIVDLRKTDKIKSASNNIELIMNFVETRFPYYYHLITGYRQIASDIAMQFLRQPEQTDADVLFWIGKLRSTESYKDYLSLISSEIFGLTEYNKNMLQAYGARIKALSTTVQNDGLEIPESVYERIGEVSMDLVLKSVRLEEAFTAQNLKDLLGLLKVGHLRVLVSNWVTVKDFSNEAFVEDYFAASAQLVAKLSDMGMIKEMNDVNSWLGRMGASSMARFLGAEGRYELTDAQGQKWTMVIVQARDMQLQALMWINGSNFARFYQTIRWDFEKSLFVASEKDLNTINMAMPSMAKFKVSNGKIEFFNPFANPQTQNMTGVMTTSYPDMMKDKTPSANYEGFYQGTIQMPDGSKLAVELTVSSLGGRYVGQLFGGGIKAYFDVGSQLNGGTLYLTSETSSLVNDFAHLRLKFEGKTLRGTFINSTMNAPISF